MPEPYWQNYSHPSDTGIRGVADTKAGAFEQAAVALTAVITEPDSVKPSEKINITCGPEYDDELLFINWISSLIYEMSTRNMLFSRFEVTIEQGRLTAAARGEKIDREKHAPAVEVKAATYADLKVEKNSAGQWLAQCIVDV